MTTLEMSTDPAAWRAASTPPTGLAPFFVLTFAISWGVWWLGAGVVDSSDAVALNLLVIAGGMGPALAALIVTAVIGGRSGLGDLLRRYDPRRRGGLAPHGVALGVFLLVLASSVISLATGTTLSADGLAAGLAQLPAMILLVALVGGGNEELGWRGFALPRLQAGLPPLTANLVLGVVWAVWHAPLWQLAGAAQSRVPFPLYVVMVVAIAVVLGYVFNATRGGLLAVVLVHTAVNVASGLKIAALGTTNALDETLTLTALAVVVVALTRGRLGAPAARPRPEAGVAGAV